MESNDHRKILTRKHFSKNEMVTHMINIIQLHNEKLRIKTNMKVAYVMIKGIN